MVRILLAVLVCLFSFANGAALAQDLDFTMIPKDKVSITYEEAIAEICKSNKVLVITRDVPNADEVKTEALSKGYLYLNADGDTRFYSGISRVECVCADGKCNPIYTEIPSHAFPNKVQGMQYKLDKESNQYFPIFAPDKKLYAYVPPRGEQPTPRPFSQPVQQYYWQTIPQEQYGVNCGPGG